MSDGSGGMALDAWQAKKHQFRARSKASSPLHSPITCTTKVGAKDIKKKNKECRSGQPEKNQSEKRNIPR